MRKIVLGSLFLSVLHSILFYGQNLGVSVLLFAIPSVFLLIGMLKKHNKVKNTKALYLSIPILLLSSTYLIFNNEFFNIVNMIVIPLLFGIMIIWGTTDVFKIKMLLGRSINLVIGSLEFIPDSLRLIKQSLRLNTKNSEKGKSKKIQLIIIGIICSIPILFIILGLLMSADEVFAGIFGEISDAIMYMFTSEVIFSIIARIALIVVVLVYLLCIIYNILYKQDVYKKVENEEFKPRIQINEIILNTILTIINIVYLLFSSIQFIYVFRYLFINPLSINGDFAFAEYARQGFFQLMIVSFINFAIILITNFNKKEVDEKTNKYTKIMNMLMAIFTVIIDISAFMRMNLYEREYGYTFLRLMVYFILLTEMFMIIPTIIYILKGKINLFKSYFIISVTMYVVINFINIDATIAKNNINRYIENKDSLTREIDFYYLSYNTGTDAIPELVRLYENVNDTELKIRINNYLYKISNSLKEDRSLQEFNISKQRAQNILEKMELKYKTVEKTIEPNKEIRKNTIESDNIMGTGSSKKKNSKTI